MVPLRHLPLQAEIEEIVRGWAPRGRDARWKGIPIMESGRVYPVGVALLLPTALRGHNFSPVDPDRHYMRAPTSVQRQSPWLVAKAWPMTNSQCCMDDPIAHSAIFAH